MSAALAEREPVLDLSAAPSLQPVWVPNPGPQTLLVTCPIWDVLYGGARGGGKTDGLLGDFIGFSIFIGQAKRGEVRWPGVKLLPGAHARGLFVRRTYDELDEAVARSHELLEPLGAVWRPSKYTWTMPWGGFLKMRYLQRDADASRYQGHCVAVGTPVLMADGTWRPIEQVAVGDMVQTLEGPRRVTATVAPYRTECVRASAQVSGQAVAEQVHPATHPILATGGLTCARTPRSPQSEGQFPHGACAQGTPAGTPHRGAGQAPQGWVAYRAGGRSPGTAGSPIPQGGRPPRALTAPVVLHAPSAHQALQGGGSLASTRCHAAGISNAPSPGSSVATTACGSGPVPPRVPAAPPSGHSGPCLPSGPACARHASPTARDCPAGCPSDSDSGGAPVRPSIGTGPGEPPSPAGAAAPRHGPPADGSGTTPTCSHPGTRGWVHPYTGEVRGLSEPVLDGEVVMVPCGEAWVADLTVEGANHYITHGGIVNRNSYNYLAVDEAGNFASPDPIKKLTATLRDRNGVPVRKRMSANPGGPGHGWLKADYVDPAPPFVPHADPDTGMLRVYIPSRLTDNLALQANDPLYATRLRGSGPAWLVQAWLNGDWNAAPEGGIIRAQWLKHYIEVPEAPVAFMRIHSWDTAYKAEQHNDPSALTDWTAATAMAKKPPGFYLRNVFRERMTYPDLKRKVIEFAERDHPDAILIEDKASGQSLLQELRNDTSLPVIAIEPDGDKVTRALRVTPLMESGRVYVPERAAWLLDYELELTLFPTKGVHDDQVDSTTQALDWMRLHAARGFTFASSGEQRTATQAPGGAGRTTDSSAGWGTVPGGTDTGGFM